MKKRRMYSLFIKQAGEDERYVRMWHWTEWTPYPAMNLDRARHVYQDHLLAPFLNGWPTRFELRPILEVVRVSAEERAAHQAEFEWRKRMEG